MFRYSLGLITPNSDQSGLIADGNDYHWKNGESITFDETYMHSAYNHSDQVRIVSMTDVTRPLRIKAIEKFYYLFYRHFNRLFIIDNVATGYSGIGNKMGKRVLV